MTKNRLEDMKYDLEFRDAHKSMVEIYALTAKNLSTMYGMWTISILK